jgi:hypothetical protein
VAKKTQKPCDLSSSACYWQFADWCLRFPKHRMDLNRRIPDFRQRDDVSIDECSDVQILTENGSRYCPLSFVAKRTKDRPKNHEDTDGGLFE